ncbi:hypothetical protein OIDMADRAFT_20931 [Oidiodendron maius Zn]|uniref:Uncharacterized protein n=1 Tax=Oidiodendron maius (strain Zn) TaxID=913774 RepID=A0A0C3GIP9_OIDMZ|nr:hypothetical protein OIDMADRAFT_20931 [Oidiodendron maius Zn]
MRIELQYPLTISAPLSFHHLIQFLFPPSHAQTTSKVGYGMSDWHRNRLTEAMRDVVVY